MKKYILASHNSWTYLPPKKWWMWLLRFTAKCQRLSIKEQYEHGVRCFDLRVKWIDRKMVVAHGIIEYDIDAQQVVDDLIWLNDKGDCFVRLIHEIRNKYENTQTAKNYFRNFCDTVEKKLTRICFWNGQNLYDHRNDYHFICEPTCEELYASVMNPKWIDDWWPWWYARLNNKRIKEEGTTKDILMIDFVDIG